MKKEDNKLKGSHKDMMGSYFEAHMRGCEEGIKENPNLVIMFDLESGYPFLATKEYRDKFLEMWESLKTSKVITTEPKLFLFGTGGKVEGKNDFNDIWNNG